MTKQEIEWDEFTRRIQKADALADLLYYRPSDEDAEEDDYGVDFSTGKGSV